MTETTDLVPHPFTGEAIDLTAPTDTLARYRHELVDFRHQLDELAHLLDQELVARMDQENARNLVAGPYKLTVKVPPQSAVWDKPELAIILEGLVSSNRISPDARDRALWLEYPEPLYKTSTRELNKLIDHPDPEVSAVVNACKTMRANSNRSVTVNLNR